MQLLIKNAERVEQIQLRTGLLSEEQFWNLCAQYLFGFSMAIIKTVLQEGPANPLEMLRAG